MRSEKTYLVNLIGSALTGSDYVYFIAYQGLKVKDFSKFDPEKAKFDSSTGTGYYRILECPNGLYTGRLNLSANWPANWEVRYAPNGAYLYYNSGTMVLVR